MFETITAYELEEIADHMNRDYIKIIPEYSGRYMFGNITPALVTDEDCRVELFEAARELDIDLNKVPRRIDSMGMNVVIY
jgi:hypothetical protein